MVLAQDQKDIMGWQGRISGQIQYLTTFGYLLQSDADKLMSEIGAAISVNSRLQQIMEELREKSSGEVVVSTHTIDLRAATQINTETEFFSQTPISRVEYKAVVPEISTQISPPYRVKAKLEWVGELTVYSKKLDLFPNQIEDLKAQHKLLESELKTTLGNIHDTTATISQKHQKSSQEFITEALNRIFALSNTATAPRMAGVTADTPTSLSPSPSPSSSLSPSPTSPITTMATAPITKEIEPNSSTPKKHPSFASIEGQKKKN